MTELETLQDRIAALASVEIRITAEGQVLLCGPGQDPWSCVVTEIAETRLPRQLIFTNDQGECLSLGVKAGRIFTVIEATSVGPASESTGFIGQLLNGASNDDRSFVTAVLDRFLGQATSVFLRRLNWELADVTTATGIQPGSLARIRALPEGSDDGGPRLQAFRAFATELVAMSPALLLIESATESKAHGAPHHLHALRVLAEQELASRQSLAVAGSAHVAEPKCIMFGGASPGADLIVCGACGDAMLFAVIHGEYLEKVSRIWPALL